MSTELKNFRKGPVKAIVERELRSLVNDVEALLRYNAVEGTVYLGKEGETIPVRRVMQAFAECMAERGIYPKENK